MSITLVSGVEEIVGTLVGTTFTPTVGDSFEVVVNEDGTYSANDKIWSVKPAQEVHPEQSIAGGKKRRSSKKSSKKSKKSSKKSSKKAKRSSKKSRKH